MAEQSTAWHEETVNVDGTELVVIKGAGHMSNMEQPQLFNDALARFLEHRV